MMPNISMEVMGAVFGATFAVLVLGWVIMVTRAATNRTNRFDNQRRRRK